MATTGKRNTDYRIKINKQPAVPNKTRKDPSILPTDYTLNLTAHIFDKPLLHSIFPGLTSFDSIHVDARLTPRQIIFNGAAPRLEYNTFTIKNAIIQIRGNDSSLTYKLTTDQAAEGKYALYYTDIHGNLSRDKITTSITLSDAARKERFAIIGDMQTIGDSQVIHLLPGLKLNYEPWEVTQPNRIVLNSTGFYVQNLDISNKGQFFKANSAQTKPNAVLKVDIGNFSPRKPYGYH